MTTPDSLEPAGATSASVAASRSGWRALLRELAVRPSKGMGQHFLTDAAIVARIADAAGLRPGALVVEIGPGLGILTGELLRRVGAAGRVVAVELDRRLAAFLREEFASEPTLTVVEADVLTQAPELLVPGAWPYLLVANLPYGITSAVFRHFLESSRRPERLVVMVQHEVAERIVARPPAMSVLAVAVQFYGQPSVVLRVGRGAFLPAPQVDSAVLRVEVAPEPPLPTGDVAPFFTLVNAGFGQRRKQLLNSLAAGLGAPKDALVPALRAAGIAPEQRAQTLTVADWLSLYAQLRRVLAR